MSLKGAKIRACIEDLGFEVVTTGLVNTYRVKTAAGAPVATYDVTWPDEAFRFATVDSWAGHGQHDCLDWDDFHGRLMMRAPKPRTE